MDPDSPWTDGIQRKRYLRLVNHVCGCACFADVKYETESSKDAIAAAAVRSSAEHWHRQISPGLAAETIDKTEGGIASDAFETRTVHNLFKGLYVISANL